MPPINVNAPNIPPGGLQGPGEGPRIDGRPQPQAPPGAPGLPHAPQSHRPGGVNQLRNASLPPLTFTPTNGVGGFIVPGSRPPSQASANHAAMPAPMPGPQGQAPLTFTPVGNTGGFAVPGGPASTPAPAQGMNDILSQMKQAHSPPQAGAARPMNLDKPLPSLPQGQAAAPAARPPQFTAAQLNKPLPPRPQFTAAQSNKPLSRPPQFTAAQLNKPLPQPPQFTAAQSSKPLSQPPQFTAAQLNKPLPQPPQFAPSSPKPTLSRPPQTPASPTSASVAPAPPPSGKPQPMADAGSRPQAPKSDPLPPQGELSADQLGALRGQPEPHRHEMLQTDLILVRGRLDRASSPDELKSLQQQRDRLHAELGLPMTEEKLEAAGQRFLNQAEPLHKTHVEGLIELAAEDAADTSLTPERRSQRSALAQQLQHALGVAAKTV
jgi:hypothetical protein